MKQVQDTYMEPQIMNFPGVTVNVYRPVLDEEERERRMKRIRKAAERVLMAAAKNGKV